MHIAQPFPAVLPVPQAWEAPGHLWFDAELSYPQVGSLRIAGYHRHSHGWSAALRKPFPWQLESHQTVIAPNPAGAGSRPWDEARRGALCCHSSCPRPTVSAGRQACPGSVFAGVSALASEAQSPHRAQSGGVGPRTSWKRPPVGRTFRVCVTLAAGDVFCEQCPAWLLTACGALRVPFTSQCWP